MRVLILAFYSEEFFSFRSLSMVEESFVSICVEWDGVERLFSEKRFCAVHLSASSLKYDHSPTYRMETATRFLSSDRR